MRLDFSYERKERAPFETTLTQNLVFAIQAYSSQFPDLSIDLQEAKNEAANGNDLELLLRFRREGKEFYAPIQCKKIGRRENYITMEHGKQIEKLIAYSSLRQGIPLYLLYNCVEDPKSLWLRYPWEQYGCSLISAHVLEQKFYNKRNAKSKGEPVTRWRIPTFGQLHDSYAFPWHQLVCGNDSLIKFSQSPAYELISDWHPRNEELPGIVPIDSTPRFEFRNEVKFPQSEGNPDKPENEEPSIPRFYHQENKESTRSEEFSPAYRITININ